MTYVTGLIDPPPSLDATDIVKKFVLLLVKYAMKEKWNKKIENKLKKKWKKINTRKKGRKPQLPVALARTRGTPYA
jgi:hypothetical protein